MGVLLSVLSLSLHTGLLARVRLKHMHFLVNAWRCAELSVEVEGISVVHSTDGHGMMAILKCPVVLCSEISL